MPTLSIDKYIYIGLGAIIFFLSLWIFSLRSDVAVLTANSEKDQSEIGRLHLQVDSFVGSVNRQNEAVDKMAINVEKAVEAFKNASPKIIEKYSSVQVKDTSCQAELDAIKQTQRIFNGDAK